MREWVEECSPSHLIDVAPNGAAYMEWMVLTPRSLLRTGGEAEME
jgi:hypothetical protein